MNRLATTHEEVAEHEALMAGVAVERRRGMSMVPGWRFVQARSETSALTPP